MPHDPNGEFFHPGSKVYRLRDKRTYTVETVNDQYVSLFEDPTHPFKVKNNQVKTLIILDRDPMMPELLKAGLIELHQEAVLVGYRIRVITPWRFEIEYWGGVKHFDQKGVRTKRFDRDQQGFEEAKAWFAEVERYNSMDVHRDSTGHLRAISEWGMYPMYYIDKENNALCPKCADDADQYTGTNDEYKPVKGEINEEDTDLYCAHCGERIPSNDDDDKKKEEEEHETNHS